MDGGRILRALLARSRPYASATQIAARLGRIFAILFAVVGVLQFSPLLLILALFIYGAAATESRIVMLDELLTGLTAADLLDRSRPEVAAATSVAELLERMVGDRTTTFRVTDGGEFVGIVTLEEVRNCDPDQRETTTVDSLMLTAEGLPRFPGTTPAFDAFVAIGESGTGAAVVDLPDGAAILTREDVATAIELERSIGRLPAPTAPM